MLGGGIYQNSVPTCGRSVADPVLSRGSKTLKLHVEDDVAVALHDLSPGDLVQDKIRAAERVAAGHKVALTAVDAGEPVKKYGQIIGYAIVPIQPGEHVHTQNLSVEGDIRRRIVRGNSTDFKA